MHNVRTANIPRGGKRGQILHKCSDMDYDVGWVDDQIGGTDNPDNITYLVATDEEIEDMLKDVFN